MLKHYSTVLSIRVSGENRRKQHIEQNFRHNNYNAIMIFDQQTVDGFYESIEIFEKDVDKMKKFILREAQECVKQTLFRRRPYVLNDHDKIYNPEFIIDIKEPSIADPKIFKIEYLKKHLSVQQYAKLCKEIYENN